jgi:hypothetical protein
MAYFLRIISKKEMNKDKIEFTQQINNDRIERIKVALTELDQEMVDADGVLLKPSQCYHFDVDPVHVLFNTNCPDDLREKVQRIIASHISEL